MPGKCDGVKSQRSQDGEITHRAHDRGKVLGILVGAWSLTRPVGSGTHVVRIDSIGIGVADGSLTRPYQNHHRHARVRALIMHHGKRTSLRSPLP